MSPDQSRRVRRLTIYVLLAFGVLTLLGAIVRPRAGLQLVVSRPDVAPQVSTESAPTMREFTNPPLVAHYTGVLRVRRAGALFFWIESPADVEFRIGAEPLANQNAEQESTRFYSTKLEPGLHPISAVSEFAADSVGPATITMRWSKDSAAPASIPKSSVFVPGTEAWQFTAIGLVRAAALVVAIAALFDLASVFLARRSYRRLIFATASAAISFLLVFVVAEVVLRIAGVKPREYVPGTIWFDYKFEPNTTTNYVGWIPYNVKEFEVPVTINAEGWRDREYAKEKAPGTYRILVVGDSYVEAKEVSLEKTFHKVLERILNESAGEGESSNSKERKFEVIARAKGGSTTPAYYSFLLDGLSYKPDLVVMSVFPGNDVRENSPELTEAFDEWTNRVYRGKVMPAKIAFIDRWLIFPWSYLNHFIVDRLAPIYASLLPALRSDLSQSDLISNEIEVYRAGEYPPVWQEAWKETLHHLENARKLAEENGAEFLVMIAHSFQVPGIDPDAVNSGYDLMKPNRVLKEWCEQQGIDYLDLEPALTEFHEKTGESYAWKYDAHWNEHGHEVAAKALLKAIAPKLKSEE